jgi:hypothetical protein
VTWHAYPAQCTTPVSLEEAERIARRYLVTRAETQAGYSLVIEEYGPCFTVLTRPEATPPADPTAPPRPPQPGSAVSVIDKETGGVSFWPSWPMEQVAQAYQEAKLAGEITFLDEWPS